MTKEKVLVLGAGTGGLVAGNLLAHHGYNVTIVDKNTTHLFQPGMLWIAFKGHNPSLYTREIIKLLKRGVQFINDKVESINLDERQVTLSTGKTLTYDYIIIALGAHLDYDATPGHRELWETFGDYFSGAKHAEKLWNKFRQLDRGTLVLGAADPLYKCPPAPHKAALLAADTLKKLGRQDKVKVILTLPFIHEYASETMAKIIKPKLDEAGIEVRTMFTVESIDTETKKIFSLEGEEISYDIAAIIPIHKGPKIEVKPENVRDSDQFIKVDKHKLNIEGYDDAYAIGDCNNTPTSKTGVTAHIGAEVVVDRILGYDSRFTGRTNCPVVADGEAAFVISDYEHPPVPVRFSKFKRLLEDIFIAAYWSSLKDPEKWSPIFRAYFRATSPEILGEAGW